MFFCIALSCEQVEFQTASGQMLDLITTFEGEKDLSKYKLPVYVKYPVHCVHIYFFMVVAVLVKLQHYSVFLLVEIADVLIINYLVSNFKSTSTSLKIYCSYRRIVQYKTAYYSFYLPVSF